MVLRCVSCVKEEGSREWGRLELGTGNWGRRRTRRIGTELVAKKGDEADGEESVLKLLREMVRRVEAME